jgi:hypothetical protein
MARACPPALGADEPDFVVPVVRRGGAPDHGPTMVRGPAAHARSGFDTTATGPLEKTVPCAPLSRGRHSPSGE